MRRNVQKERKNKYYDQCNDQNNNDWVLEIFRKLVPGCGAAGATEAHCLALVQAGQLRWHFARIELCSHDRANGVYNVFLAHF